MMTVVLEYMDLLVAMQTLPIMLALCFVLLAIYLLPVGAHQVLELVSS